MKTLTVEQLGMVCGAGEYDWEGIGWGVELDVGPASVEIKGNAGQGANLVQDYFGVYAKVNPLGRLVQILGGFLG